jgi:hypothetical protein
MDDDEIFTELDLDMLFDSDFNGGRMDSEFGNTTVWEDEAIESTTLPLTQEDTSYIRQVKDIVSMYKDLLGFVENVRKGLVETCFCYIRSNKYVKYLLLTEIRNVMDDNNFIKQKYIDRYYEIQRIYFVYTDNTE